MMKVEKIYFDMDGVLADFERGVRELCGLVPPSQNGIHNPHDDDRMWESIRSIENFYDKLELIPGAEEMFHAVYDMYGDRCEILTGVPKPKRGILTAGDDKTKWMHRLLAKDIKVNIVHREDKPRFCTGKGSILIDDMENNIRDWKASGGTGIVHRSAADTLREL